MAWSRPSPSFLSARGGRRGTACRAPTLDGKYGPLPRDCPLGPWNLARGAWVRLLGVSERPGQGFTQGFGLVVGAFPRQNLGVEIQLALGGEGFQEVAHQVAGQGFNHHPFDGGFHHRVGPDASANFFAQDSVPKTPMPEDSQIWASVVGGGATPSGVNPVRMLVIVVQVFIWASGNVMLSQPQRRNIRGGGTAPDPKPFTEFILRGAEGFRVISEKFAHGVG